MKSNTAPMNAKTIGKDVSSEPSVPVPMESQSIAEKKTVHRKLSASSIFALYLENKDVPPYGSEHSFLDEYYFDQLPHFNKSSKKDKCCKCSKKEKSLVKTKNRKRFCCKRDRKISSKSLNSKIFGQDDLSNDFSEETETGNKANCCKRILRWKSRKKTGIREDEQDWIEDIDENVEHLTPEFVHWLAQTYKRDKKGTSRKRIAQMKARQSWRKLTSKIRSRDSIVSLYSIHEDKSKDVHELLEDIGKWDFDTFLFQDVSDNHALPFIGREIIHIHGFSVKFQIKPERLKNFLQAIEAGYSMFRNPYHNDRHAADVAQTCHCIIQARPEIHNVFTDLEIFALLFGALIHDLAHTGQTNHFHVNSQSNLAILYNDRNVLENHHLASAFQILKNPKCNILENLTRDEYREFRELIIEMVLATDMACHFQNIKTCRGYLRAGEWNGTSHKCIAATLSLILHGADISNPAKPWHIHKQCSDSLMAELRTQGIQEKLLKIPISPLCDPKEQTPGTNIAFIEIIVQPTLQVLGDLLDFILQNETKEEETTQVKNKEKTRRVTIQNYGSRERLLSTVRGRNTSNAGNASLRLSKSSRQDENLLQLRPWIPHLCTNIAQWRTIQEKETENTVTKSHDRKLTIISKKY